jgi:pilus assembly protein CpaE
MTGIDALKVVVERSTGVAVLSDQSILASRSSQHLVRALRNVDCRLDNVGLVIDRHQRRQGLEPSKIAELLQLPLFDSLGGDPTARLQAMNAGESLFKIAPRDEYCQDVQRLSHAMMERRAPEGTDTDTRGGFFGRWLG